MEELRLDFNIRRQPDDTTCGPTCLHSIYAFYKDPIDLREVISQTPEWVDGGTLAVYLACHALGRGYRTTIIPYNLRVFDPTWFDLPAREIGEKLRRQLAHKKDRPGLAVVTNAYLEYIRLGGRLRFEVITPSLIRRYLKRSIPILAGLSATYLYGSAREVDTGGEVFYDDIRGESNGHFVVLTGYSREDRGVRIADPLKSNPIAGERYYSVPIYRLVCALMLGVLTYDGNLLIIELKKKRGP